MIQTPVTQMAAKVAVQLETQIENWLADDPEMLNLFNAYVGLMDSLAGGTSGGKLLVSYDDLVADDMRTAQAALEGANA